MKWAVKAGKLYLAENADNNKYSYTWTTSQTAAYVLFNLNLARRLAKEHSGRVVRLVPKQKPVSNASLRPQGGILTIRAGIMDAEDIAHMAEAGKPGGEVAVTANGWRVGRVVSWSVTWG